MMPPQSRHTALPVGDEPVSADHPDKHETAMIIALMRRQ